jgi:hypothetical protein
VLTIASSTISGINRHITSSKFKPYIKKVSALLYKRDFSPELKTKQVLKTQFRAEKKESFKQRKLLKNPFFVGNSITLTADLFLLHFYLLLRYWEM